ncbi:MAG TPA: xanthine dehydrogenase family protein molybdopterin-binding subunit [Chloroflexota bacterium]|nr:xanthine dehydrogenase family protein molybdopterin-binding subunit [Chloroflexota bacterium]
MAATYTVVGTSLRRAEGEDKVTGRQRYTADVLLPGTLWGKALRSPLPYARIVRIDTTAARALPGVQAVLTADDLPNRLIGRRMYDITMLARGLVRHVGEKVAVVAADDPDTAEEALGLIDVEYEELRPVFDPFAAMQPDAPLLHPDIASYRNAMPEVFDQHNVQSYATWGQGDLARGFAEAELVYEDEFTVPMQHQGHIEPHGCLVHVADDGQVRIWHTGKQPFQTRDWLAEAVGLPPERVTVYPVAIGGDFGGKGFLTDEPVAYYLSRATGRPVRMLMTYTEELTAGVPRHGAVVRIKTGLNRDGRLVARQVQLYFNGGAYGGYKPNLNLGGARYACGNYRIPHGRIDSYCVYTNQIPCGHMRSPGEAQANFAVESHTDMLARRLGMDPVAFRLLNVVQEGDVSAIGERWTNPRAREVIERAAQEIGWDAPKPPHVGRGLATCNHDIGQGKAGSIVAVDESGAVTVITGVPDVGTGAHTMLRQVVAEELSIAPDDVTVQVGDTDTALWDSGSGGQRVTHVHGTATLRAAGKLREALCELAPDLMRWPASGVRLERGEFMAEGGGRSVPFRELAARAARASGGRVAAQEALTLSYESGERTYTAQAVEVAVDPESGRVEVRRAVSVQDSGRVLNPQLAEGQVQGATVMGMGYGIMEGIEIEDGRVLSSNLGEYKLPSMRDVPELRTVFVDAQTGPCPFGSKAVAEAAISPLSAAIANAVDDAVGARVTDLPVTAEKVYRQLQAR